ERADAPAGDRELQRHLRHPDGLSADHGRLAGGAAAGARGVPGLPAPDHRVDRPDRFEGLSGVRDAHGLAAHRHTPGAGAADDGGAVAAGAGAAGHRPGRDRRDEDRPVVRTMWGVWRESLLRSNLAAAPAGLLAAAAAGNLVLLSTGGLGGPGPAGALLATAAALVLVLSGLTWAISVTLAADPALSTAEVLRAGVLFPFVFPGTGLSLLVTLAAVGLLGAVVPVAAVLAGGAAAMLCTEVLVSARRRLLTEHLAPA